MSQVEQSAEEVFDSITGHDEMAIAQHFGKTVAQLLGDPHMLGRALVFVSRRRLDGVNDDDARNFALDLPHKQLNETYFAEPVDAEADDEAGKGEPDDVLPPVNLLPSAS